MSKENLKRIWSPPKINEISVKTTEHGSGEGSDGFGSGAPTGTANSAGGGYNGGS
jgi:hypothetical protein